MSLIWVPCVQPLSPCLHHHFYCFAKLQRSFLFESLGAAEGTEDIGLKGGASMNLCIGNSKLGLDPSAQSINF